jgi:hypothetical protein
MDTSGFYKLIDDVLIHAPSWIESQDYRLERAKKDTYEYPVDGWEWFDAEESAFSAHGLVPPQPERTPTLPAGFPGVLGGQPPS